MDKILNEIKKIAENEKIDIKKFDKCIECINGEKEMREKWEKENEELKKENKQLTDEKTTLENEKKTLVDEKEKIKTELTDLKIKYCERFNSPPEEKDKKNEKADITIKDLFETP